jgi:hypothetical protein
VLGNDLVNEYKIDVSGDVNVKSARGIYNYRHFYAGKMWIKGEYFCNVLKTVDGAMQAYRNGGDVVAEWIEMDLSGKRKDLVLGELAFLQSFDARMEAKSGIRIMAREGGVYVGFRKEMQDGKIIIEGSKLIVQDGSIVIQAAGDVIFDGSEVRGKATFAESKGEIKEQNPLIIRDADVSYENSWCKGIEWFDACTGATAMKPSAREPPT